jgi:hypothetical protein
LGSMRRAALLALGFLVLSAGGSGAASAPPLLRLTGPVKELAADGGRVAVLLQTSSQRCTRGRVAVWQPSTRSLAPIGASPCSESLSTGAGIYSVAFAGTRVAYVQFGGGNIRELELRSATLAQRRPVTIASASFGLDESSGTYIGRVAGDGALLAFDWWNLCPACASDARPQPDRSAVWRIAAGGTACPNAGLGALRRCAVVQAGFGDLRLLSVAGGSLALLQPDGSVAVSSPSGVASATIPFAAGELRAARLDTDGRTLAALVVSGGRNALRVYDAAGGLMRTFPLPAARTSGDGTCGDPSGCRTPALRLEDVQSGIAVYVLGPDVHLLRLADGKSAVVRAPGRSPVHAQLEPDGLYYSYLLAPRASRVAFLPFAAVQARIGR